MGLAVSALTSPRAAPPLHEASADCMIALLTRIEREECSELEVSFYGHILLHFFRPFVGGEAQQKIFLLAGEHSSNSVHNGGELPACSE